jgi:LPXTG-site transpeptidase (sortase) family protein
MIGFTTRGAARSAVTNNKNCRNELAPARPEATCDGREQAPSPRSSRFVRGRCRRSLAAVAFVALPLAAMLAGCGGGGKKTPTAEETAYETSTPEPLVNAGLKSPIPVSPGDELSDDDLSARGTGVPGRGDFTGDRLIIPKIGVDAPFSVKVVGADGQMGNPISWDDVVYYDFSQWPDFGGLPNKGGNIVVAGHVDYIRHGPAVFWDLHTLVQGDRVQIRLSDGSLTEYEVMFNKSVGEDRAKFEQIVTATKDESVTLITCSGVFEAGHYNNRQIVWARRV